MTSSVTLIPQLTMELVARSTDTVGTLTLTVVRGVRADVMVQRGDRVERGATLERLPHLQRHLELKSPCLVRLRKRLALVVILLMVHAAREMVIPFVAIGQTVLVVLSMG